MYVYVCERESVCVSQLYIIGWIVPMMLRSLFIKFVIINKTSVNNFVHKSMPTFQSYLL